MDQLADCERPRSTGGEQHKLARESGKENQSGGQQLEKLCFECNKTLAKSRHIINISGRSHRWHSECFKCAICGRQLDRESSCHLHGDKIVCRADFGRLRRDHSVKCARCQWPIAPTDWVRKADEHVYHLACFSCDLCLRQLDTGEQFTISCRSEAPVRLLCRLHFAVEALECRGSQRPARYELAAQCPPLAAGDEQQAAYLQLLEAAKQQVERPADGQRVSSSSNSTSGSSASLAGLVQGSAAGSKSKRVRTTFTEDQLSILQTHFQIDSNPDGQDLERIATITGLSKRVTQVWFQNSRARQKKYMIKRKPAQEPAGQQQFARNQLLPPDDCCPRALVAGLGHRNWLAGRLDEVSLDADDEEDGRSRASSSGLDSDRLVVSEPDEEEERDARTDD